MLLNYVKPQFKTLEEAEEHKLTLSNALEEIDISALVSTPRKVLTS